MISYEVTESELKLSITTKKEERLFINLPRVVDTFAKFVAVDVYTGDSDPVYWAIARAYQEWDRDWATRFCVAMLAYYHTGTAAQAADYKGNAFWDYLDHIYPSTPRGSERRHFRGTAGIAALAHMRNWSPDPDYFFQAMPDTYAAVQIICESQFIQFGPYFQLKICDYMDRCLNWPIRSYFGLDRNLPSEPDKAIRLIYPELSSSKGFQKLCKEFEGTNILAAPHFDRQVGPAELETSLCGWKTTKYSGNWFGADIEDKRNALKGFGPKAEALAEFMPPVPARDLFRCYL